MKISHTILLVALIILAGLAGSCKKKKAQELRNAEIVDILYIDHESAQVTITYDIQDIENATVGLNWVESSNQARSNNFEVFSWNDTLITFVITDLYADLSYTIEPYIHFFENGSHVLQTYETMNFHTDNVPSVSCSTSFNEVELDGSPNTATSFYHQELNYDYLVSFDVSSYDINLIFAEEPYSGVFTTTKSALSFGNKEVRVEAEMGSVKYRCEAGKEIHFTRDDKYSIINSNLSVSFCDLVLTRFDTFTNDTITLSGEANNQ